MENAQIKKNLVGLSSYFVDTGDKEINIQAHHHEETANGSLCFFMVYGKGFDQTRPKLMVCFAHGAWKSFGLQETSVEPSEKTIYRAKALFKDYIG